MLMFMPMYVRTYYLLCNHVNYSHMFLSIHNYVAQGLLSILRKLKGPPKGSKGEVCPVFVLDVTYRYACIIISYHYYITLYYPLLLQVES